MPRVKIVLNTVECIETEDNIGSDEFYVAAVLAKGKSPNFEFIPAVTGTWDFSNGQKRELNEPILAADVDFNQDFFLFIKCFDKDAAEDLTDTALARAASHAAAIAREAASLPVDIAPNESALARLVIDTISGTIEFFWDFLARLVALDEDDLLGENETSLLIPGFPNPATGIPEIPPSFSRVWPTQFFCRYDGCLYRVVYSIHL